MSNTLVRSSLPNEAELSADKITENDFALYLTEIWEYCGLGKLRDIVINPSYKELHIKPNITVWKESCGCWTVVRREEYNYNCDKKTKSHYGNVSATFQDALRAMRSVIILAGGEESKAIYWIGQNYACEA